MCFHAFRTVILVSTKILRLLIDTSYFIFKHLIKFWCGACRRKNLLHSRRLICRVFKEGRTLMGMQHLTYFNFWCQCHLQLFSLLSVFFLKQPLQEFFYCQLRIILKMLIFELHVLAKMVLLRFNFFRRAISLILSKTIFGIFQGLIQIANILFKMITFRFIFRPTSRFKTDVWSNRSEVHKPIKFHLVSRTIFIAYCGLLFVLLILIKHSLRYGNWKAT